MAGRNTNRSREIGSGTAGTTRTRTPLGGTRPHGYVASHSVEKDPDMSDGGLALEYSFTQHAEKWESHDKVETTLYEMFPGIDLVDEKNQEAVGIIYSTWHRVLAQGDISGMGMVRDILISMRQESMSAAAFKPPKASPAGEGGLRLRGGMGSLKKSRSTSEDPDTETDEAEPPAGGLEDEFIHADISGKIGWINDVEVTINNAEVNIFHKNIILKVYFFLKQHFLIVFLQFILL